MPRCRNGTPISSSGSVVAVTFRSEGEELDVLRRAGHPFFVLGSGRDALAMAIDADTDWGEVEDLVTESFCVGAPKKLSALIDRPSGC